MRTGDTDDPNPPPLGWPADGGQRETMSHTRSPARAVRLTFGALIRLAPGVLRFSDCDDAASPRLAAVFIRFDPRSSTRDRIASLSLTPTDHPFITGNALAARCRYVINFDDLTVNENVDNDWWFCRSDVVEYFFSKHEPAGEYVLFSHNSDRPDQPSLRRFLLRRGLRAALSMGCRTSSSQAPLVPVRPRRPALGVMATARCCCEYRRWSSRRRSSSTRATTSPTFPPAREYCRRPDGTAPKPRREFDEYPQGLASSYFCIAPRGNGIDTDIRVGEALYLKTIPIVIRSVVAEQHADLPIVMLDDWAEFHEHRFSPELYDQLMRDWSPEIRRLDRYMERVERTLRVQS